MPDTTAPSQPNATISQPAPPAAPSPPIASQPAVKTPLGKKSFGRKQLGVLLITRTQLCIYVEGKADVVTYSFTSDVVRDLDVVNQEVLQEKITALLTQQQVPPANFFVVLSNQTLFSKQVTAGDVNQKKVEEEKFLNTVPFEVPSVQHMTLGSNTYIVVANEQLFSAFEEVFKKVGSEFLLVLPEFLFAKELNLAQGLSVSSAQVLLKKMQEFKAFSFVRKELPGDGQNGGEGEDKKFKLQVSGGKSNRRLVIGGVLIMVVGVLLAAFLYVQQNKPVQPPPPATSDVTPGPVVPTEIPEGFQTLSPASDGAEFASPSAVVEGDTSSDITLQYTDQNAYTAGVIADRLRLLGFGSIIMQRVSITGSAPQVTFRPTVSAAVERLLVGELKKQYGEIILRENSTATNDIVIFIGSNPND